MDVVAPELRAATVYGLQTDVGTFVDAIMTIVSQRQVYLPWKFLSDEIAAHNGNDSNERIPASVRDPIFAAFDPNPPAPGSGRLSNASGGIERDPEPPLDIIILTRSHLADREHVAADQQQQQQQGLMADPDPSAQVQVAGELVYSAPVTYNEFLPKDLWRIAGISWFSR